MKNTLKLVFSQKFILSLFQSVFLYIPLNLYTRIFGCKNIVLICERSIEARDNGFVLYKWIRENHPEIRAIYAIKHDCKDYLKVKDLGETVEYGSLRHWLYYLRSKVLCDTSWDICCPNSLVYLIMRNILPMKNKRVFLQHGITKDYMSQGRKEKLYADLFVCGAFPEWKYISQHFGYSDKEVKYLGFPRFDNLTNLSESNKIQILFMPTWRMHLNSIKDFTNTEYYRRIMSFLSSERLCKILNSQNIEFVYFMHPALKNKKHLFNEVTHSNIILLNNDDADMQEYLCSCNILITDYSSVYFDVAYQNKPVIYYQYDYNDYRKGHYSEGYFNYRRDGFGPVVETEDELFDALELMLNNHCQIPMEYEKRVIQFFPMRDSENTRRNYDAIKLLL